MAAFTQTPIPLILTIGGLVFLFAAVFGGLGSFASLPKERQSLAGVVGILLLLGGVAPYLLPLEVVSMNAEVVEPTRTMGETFAVDAKQAWQTTGIRVEKGARLHIEVVGGEWTNWKGTTLYQSGKGTGYVCAGVRPAVQCVEYLPEAPTGALIGRVGVQIFLIGEGTTIVAEQQGTLSLAINDTPDGFYDNDGVLTVSIVVDE
jgi:hypothetical protein